jgi:hypothetical protein
MRYPDLSLKGGVKYDFFSIPLSRCQAPQKLPKKELKESEDSDFLSTPAGHKLREFLSSRKLRGTPLKGV